MSGTQSYNNIHYPKCKMIRAADHYRARFRNYALPTHPLARDALQAPVTAAFPIRPLPLYVHVHPSIHLPSILPSDTPSILQYALHPPGLIHPHSIAPLFPCRLPPLRPSALPPTADEYPVMRGVAVSLPQQLVLAEMFQEVFGEALCTPPHVTTSGSRAHSHRRLGRWAAPTPTQQTF